MPDRTSDRPAIAVLNWRDASHPEGGGSERYVHRIAEALAADGWRVTFVCADHGQAPRDETVDGVRFRRRGGRHTVYLRALAYVAAARPDMVLDVQNAVPFASPLVTRRPVVVLVHHVHREQWPILFGRWLGPVGWFVESRMAPWVYRRCPYVAVSGATADELAGLGVERSRVAIVHNGVEPPPPVVARRSPAPRLIVVGRLVPHKQVEHAIDALARLAGRGSDVVLDVVGDGWWAPQLRAHAQRLGVADRVVFHGFVDEQTKHELIAGAWLHLCPSVKEGWGIAVTEAAAHGVPTVAYRSAGGTRESVRDGVTGLLADDPAEFARHVERLLADGTARTAMASAAVADAARYTVTASTDAFAALLDRARTARRSRASARAVVQHVIDRHGGVRALTGDAADSQHGARPEHDTDRRHDDERPQPPHGALTFSGARSGPSLGAGRGDRPTSSADATLGQRPLR